MEFTWWIGDWAIVVNSHLLLVFMDKRVAKVMAAFLSRVNIFDKRTAGNASVINRPGVACAVL